MTQTMDQSQATDVEQDLEQLRAEVKALRETAEDLQRNMHAQQQPVVRTEYPHIIKVEGVRGGSPILSESYISVKTIAAFMKNGLAPEQLVEDYAGELTLAQVYEALAYYYRHTAEIESYLKADEEANEERWHLSRERAMRHRAETT